MPNVIDIGGLIVDRDGYRRARMLAQWELGSAGWGDEILRAYLDPNHPGLAEALTELGDASEWEDDGLG